MGDQVDYNALFGVEADASENTQGEGGNEQTVAGSDESEPAAENEAADDQDKAADPEGSGEGTQSEGKPAQSPEENSKYAAARRKAEAERDLAVQKAREEVRAQMKAEFEGTIKALGMVNPYTKQPIVDQAGLDEYRQKFEIEKKSKVAKRAGMNDQEFQQFVEDLPEVKEARAKAEQAEAAQKAVAAERAKAEMDRQIAEIREMDSSIQSIEDFPKMENYQQFYALVKRGNTFTDAYKLANFDRLTSQNAQQAKQAALNQVNSKSHLDRTTTRGAGAVTVPADVIAEYKALNPTATNAEIQAHYAKYMKK